MRKKRVSVVCVASPARPDSKRWGRPSQSPSGPCRVQVCCNGRNEGNFAPTDEKAGDPWMPGRDVGFCLTNAKRMAPSRMAAHGVTSARPWGPGKRAFQAFHLPACPRPASPPTPACPVPGDLQTASTLSAPGVKSPKPAVSAFCQHQISNPVSARSVSLSCRVDQHRIARHRPVCGL